MFFQPKAHFPQIPVLTLSEAAGAAQSAGPIALLTWDREQEAALRPLAEALGPRLLLPEVWSCLFPQAGVLVSSALCGGALRLRFQDAARTWPRRCWLLVEPMAVTFPLPCPTGQGTPLAVLPDTKGFFSEALCCRYSHHSDGQFSLWDTEQTLQHKLDTAQECGFLGFTLQPEGWPQWLLPIPALS